MARRRHEGGQEPAGARPPGEGGGPGTPDPGQEESSGQEGTGPRFRRGSDDLDQLEGIEKQQKRSRKARRQLEQAEEQGEQTGPELNYPLIESTDKSRRRVKNRFNRIKDSGEAVDEYSD